jgi:hypothetical protein
MQRISDEHKSYRRNAENADRVCPAEQMGDRRRERN